VELFPDDGTEMGDLARCLSEKWNAHIEQHFGTPGWVAIEDTSEPEDSRAYGITYMSNKQALSPKQATEYLSPCKWGTAGYTGILAQIFSPSGAR